MIKMIILFLSAIFMLNSAAHYMFYPDGFVITVSILSMEILRLIIFFSVFYYFTVQVVNLLKN
jgi:hypothetical protein